jgi:hypothetical protein
MTTGKRETVLGTSAEPRAEAALRGDGSRCREFRNRPLRAVWLRFSGWREGADLMLLGRQRDRGLVPERPAQESKLQAPPQ